MIKDATKEMRNEDADTIRDNLKAAGLVWSNKSYEVSGVFFNSDEDVRWLQRVS